MRETGTAYKGRPVGGGRGGEARGGRSKGRGRRGPIDVGAVQVAPLIAPQRVQLCGPSAITAHSARHLTPPAALSRPSLLYTGFTALKPTNPILSRVRARYIARCERTSERARARARTGAIVSFYLNAPRRVGAQRPV